MIKNVGSTDRLIRLIAGVILLIIAVPSLAGMAFVGLGGWAWLVGLIGLGLLASGLLNFCAVYSLLGINTSKIAD
ncbi:conserved hypothetical protein [uncultured Pleomorphomonas sp.]|uniref:Inner membrane protein YgaP-like transmembrane domain-containing protein n=2 Tax=Pleomorphomonas TaxID=261933 RepID=A0A2G9WRS0_9HYPH|nr:DUF2892 domain-containing protein [Pleomorphomonas carboxyditropha]PIO97022.1 hypothetical protein CJ014_22235 [Pleomorphomonas carboxyditropha]SCM77091.1 conserved hypothetical protein [uncultured Pleomorphomonas sp.]